MKKEADSAKIIPLPTAQAGSAPTPSPARQEEALLVARCKNGDRQAFRTLVERYERKVYALAFGMLRDPDEARDLSQEAFLKVFRNLESFQGTSSFYTWLYRITVNLCIDQRRKKSHKGHAEFDERIVHEEVGSPADQLSAQRLGFDPAAALHNGELRKRLFLALEQLSEQHRAVLLLREVDGLSYKEISDTLDCPEGTVMSRLFHARQKMQDLLREYADLEKDKEAANAGRG